MNVTHQPYKELVIYQLVKTDLKTFKKTLLTTDWRQCRWIDGILYVHTVPASMEYYESMEYSDGRIFWPYVEFAKCEKMPEDGIIKTENTGAASLVVVDVSNNELAIGFARWLKTQKIWEDANATN